MKDSHTHTHKNEIEEESARPTTEAGPSVPSVRATS